MDVLIGDRAHHPSLRLEAGQVAGFAAPPGAAICPHCGHRYDDATYHPGGVTTPDGLLTYGGDPVTYGGDYVTYGV